MQKVTKAVIPAAGLGTRMLPISHAVPKEMLPIVDLPAVAYLVEEAAKSGITDILVITNRDKDAIEDFFDYSPEYEAALNAKGRGEDAAVLRRFADLANVTFLRQKEAKGLGHAVGRARAFVGDEPFVVLYGDDVIFSRTPVAKQLIDAYEKYERPVVGVKRVAPEQLQKYCSLKVSPIEGDTAAFYCDDMIEKPKPGEEFSNLSILGRVLLTPAVFDIIDALPPGAGGEIQLTDAMAKIARESGVTALEFEGDRYDLGSKVGFLTANVVAGASHPETGEEFRAFLKRFVAEMDK
ncbi:MAG: UTP--glucose-1-phosphate uridylyltransferase [Clostridia bacterium]|nr:UTP--glucose-1-phosphate uridylyltransferase [Clostridia bacterium]